MTHSVVVDELAATADEVWKFFGWRIDKKRLKQMHEAGALPGPVHWSGDHPGATRTISMADDNQVIERLEAMEEKDFRYSYRIIDAGPLPVTGYLGQVEITTSAPGTCKIVFSAEFNEAAYEAMHQDFCHAAINAVSAIISGD